MCLRASARERENEREREREREARERESERARERESERARERESEREGAREREREGERGKQEFVQLGELTIGHEYSPQHRKPIKMRQRVFRYYHHRNSQREPALAEVLAGTVEEAEDLRLMDKILHYLKYPKLWELWYIPYYGSCRILSINRSSLLGFRVSGGSEQLVFSHKPYSNHSGPPPHTRCTFQACASRA